MAQKLRRIILLHLQLPTFRFHFPKIQKIIMFMFWPSECDHDSQPQLYLIFWDTAILQSIHENSPIIFENNWKSQNLGTPTFKKKKRWGPTIPDDQFKKFLEILNMWSISSRKHEMTIWYWIWDRYLSTKTWNRNLLISNLRSLTN